MLEGISGFYRVFRVFLAVSERFLLILKGFGQTYCVFGPIDPPDRALDSRSIETPMIDFDHFTTQWTEVNRL